MIDREKVIKGLECCTFILGKRKCNECPYQKGLPDNECYQLQDDFHALLKEHEVDKKPNEIYVQCKNCKHGYKIPDSPFYQCAKPHSSGEKHTEDWYCADGKCK